MTMPDSSDRESSDKINFSTEAPTLTIGPESEEID